VLVRICHSWAEACERARLPLRDADWIASTAAIEARRQVMFAYQDGELETDDYYERLSLALAERYSPVEVARLHDAWLIEEYPGVLAVVEQLAARNDVETACLSNTNARHWEMLAPESGPARYPAIARLGRRFASHLMRVSKPEPRIYLEFQRAVGLAPADILFFDDLHPNIDAARSAGWRAERIDPAGDPSVELRRHLLAHGIALGGEEALT
jgi:HAD superfamily hydrolase (TIGR01509 family)